MRDASDRRCDIYIQFLDESKKHQRRKGHELSILDGCIARHAEKFGYAPQECLCGPTTAEKLSGAPIPVRTANFIAADLYYVGCDD
jgi:hypothetical protein